MTELNQIPPMREYFAYVFDATRLETQTIRPSAMSESFLYRSRNCLCLLWGASAAVTLWRNVALRLLRTTEYLDTYVGEIMYSF